MTKNESLRKISIKLVIAIPILFVGYIVFLRFFRLLLPLPIDLFIFRIFPIVLVAGVLLLIPSLIISDYPILIRIILIPTSVMVCCFFSLLYVFVFGLPLEKIYASAELGEYNYHITMHAVFDEHKLIYNFYECNSYDMACEKICQDVGGSDFNSPSFIVDERMGEVHAFRGWRWMCTGGVQPREIHWYQEFNDSIYAVGSYLPYISSSDRHTNVIHKCEPTFTSCQQLPFKYVDIGHDFYMKFDESTDELIVYKWNWETEEEVLIYSYSAEPKCYVEGCTIPDE